MASSARRAAAGHRDGRADPGIHRSGGPYTARHCGGHRVSRAARRGRYTQPPAFGPGLAGTCAGRGDRTDRTLARASEPERRGLCRSSGLRLGRVHRAHPARRRPAHRAAGLAMSLGTATIVAAPVAAWPALHGLTPGIALQGLGLAALVPLLPFSLELLALRRIRVAAFGTLMALEPGIAVVIGLLLLERVARRLGDLARDSAGGCHCRRRQHSGEPAATAKATHSAGVSTTGCSVPAGPSTDRPRDQQQANETQASPAAFRPIHGRDLDPRERPSPLAPGRPVPPQRNHLRRHSGSTTSNSTTVESATNQFDALGQSPGSRTGQFDHSQALACTET